jgi:predicted MPP superfamily phosphohydrolase
LKIAFITDIHIESFTKPQEIAALFEKTTAQNADLIIIGGDVLDTDIMKGDRYKEYGFDRLKAKYGVFAVSGNHDFYSRIKIFTSLCEKTGVRLLDDDCVLIADELNLVGIRDVDYSNPAAVKAAIEKADKRYPVLFISHHPESFDAAAAVPGYRLVQLSGHTHAGQIPPVEIVRRFFMKYNYGFYHEGDDVMYVTSGARQWGPPMRLGNIREIFCLTLRPPG